MARNRYLPRHLATACALMTALAVSACGGGDTGSAPTPAPAPVSSAAPAPAASQAGSGASASTGGPSATASTSSVPTVPGYQPGEIPPIPLFTVPDLSLLTATSVFTPDMTRSITSVPGVTVSPARCDDGGTLNGGNTILYGDGSGTHSDGNSVVNNYGDGSGSYSDDRVTINVYGDGSGNYMDDHLLVNIYDDGSGSYTNSLTNENINVYADGAGNYTRGNVTVNNYGDGSGNYTDGKLTINNHGDGTADVNGTTVKADPLPKVGTLSRFPSLETLPSATSCGTVITLEDSVLFDFGSSEVRADAAGTLRSLATVLTSSGAPRLVVNGHTDSVSDDAFNQTLSEKRAQAVVQALRGDGVTASMEAVGYGESRPVAPNTNPDGSDNPAGRQLNRRVEIFVPTF